MRRSAAGLGYAGRRSFTDAWFTAPALEQPIRQHGDVVVHRVDHKKLVSQTRGLVYFSLTFPATPWHLASVCDNVQSAWIKPRIVGRVIIESGHSGDSVT